MQSGILYGSKKHSVRIQNENFEEFCPCPRAAVLYVAAPRRLPGAPTAASAMLPEMQRASVVLLLISSRSHHGPRTGFRGVGFWQSGTTLTGANKEEVGIDRPVQRPRPAHHRCVVSELRKYV